MRAVSSASAGTAANAVNAIAAPTVAATQVRA